MNSASLAGPAFISWRANTSGGVNYLATGLGWRFDLGPRFYLQPGLGVALHDRRVNRAFAQ